MSAIRSWFESSEATFGRKTLKYLQRNDWHKFQLFLKSRNKRKNEQDINNVLLDGVHSSLTYACKVGASVDMLKILIDNGADINRCCSDKKTPLMLAVINQHKDVVKYILKFCNPNLELLDSHQKNVLNYSYKNKDVEQLLIQCGAKYPLTDVMLSRPSVYSGVDLTSAKDAKLVDKLWEVCTSRLIDDDICNDKLIRLIIDFPALEQELTSELLIKTVESGKFKCVQFLIQSGVDCTYVDETGMSVLSVSIYQNHTHITKYLLSLNPLKELESNAKIPAVHIASTYGYDDVIKLLVEHGVDVNILDSKRWTAMHHAVKNRQISTIILLVKLNADVMTLNDEGQLPVDYLGKGYDAIKRLLYVAAASKSKTGDYKAQFERAMLHAEKLYSRAGSPKSPSTPRYASPKSTYTPQYAREKSPPPSHNSVSPMVPRSNKVDPRSETKKTAKIKAIPVVSPPSATRNPLSLYSKTTASSRSRSLSPSKNNTGVKGKNDELLVSKPLSNQAVSKLSPQKIEEKTSLQDMVKNLLDSYDLTSIKNVSDEDLILLSKISVALNTLVHSSGKRGSPGKNMASGAEGEGQQSPAASDTRLDEETLSLSPIINRKESGKCVDIEVSSPVSVSQDDSKDNIEKDMIRRISVLHTDSRPPLSPNYHLSSPMLHLRSASVENQLYFDKVSPLLKINEAALWIAFSYFSSVDKKTLSSLHYLKLRYTKCILSLHDLTKLFRTFEVIPSICSEAEIGKTVTIVAVDSDSPGNEAKRPTWYKKPKSIPQSICFNYFLKILAFIARNKYFRSKDSSSVSAASELYALGKLLRVLDRSGGRAQLLAGGKVLPKFDLSLGSILASSPVEKYSPSAPTPVSSGERVVRKEGVPPAIAVDDMILRRISVTANYNMAKITNNYISFDSPSHKSAPSDQGASSSDQGASSGGVAVANEHISEDLFE